MTTLYIDRKDTLLKQEGNTLVSYIAGVRQRPVPLALLERVVIVSNVSLTSHVLGKLAEQGIAVMLVNMRKSGQQATLIGAEAKNPHIRLVQYRASENPVQKAEIARQLVLAKVRNHHRFYTEVAQQRDDLRHPLGKAIDALAAVVEQLRQQQPAVESLRGIEGHAAKTAFGAYAHLFADSLGFTGRKRRPPPDPVNAVLSLSYTLLHYRAVQVSYAAGLDPMIGFLHENAYSRDSLAADLIEPWRPYIDEWVWQWFQQRYLRHDHFNQADNACVLGKRGREKFYGAFERRMRPMQRLLRWQVNALKQALMQQGDDE